MSVLWSTSRPDTRPLGDHPAMIVVAVLYTLVMGLTWISSMLGGFDDPKTPNWAVVPIALVASIFWPVLLPWFAFEIYTESPHYRFDLFGDIP